MVVAELGLGMGVIRQEVYSVVVLMAVAITLVAPVLLTLSHRSAGAGPPSADFPASPGG